MGMCAAELETWINRLKEEADELLDRYKSECYLCETRLVHMETIVQSIRYEKSKEQSE